MTDHGKSASKTSKIGDVSSATYQNKVEAKKPQSRSVSFQRVTYGGIDGAYYTTTSSRRTGDDGVCLVTFCEMGFSASSIYSYVPYKFAN